MSGAYAARLLGATVIVASMLAGAVESGPTMALAIGAGALAFAAGLLVKRAWVAPVAAIAAVAALHDAGPMAGIGAGLFVAGLLYLATYLVKPRT